MTRSPTSKQMRERLHQALEESGLNKTALARAAGVSQASVSQWFSGDTKSISSEHIFRAARALGVSPEWLATGRGPKSGAVSNVKLLDNNWTVPIIPWNMAQDLDSVGPDVERAPYVSGGRHTFALRLEGDSMVGDARAFHAGELIHVDPDQREVASGDFVVAHLTSSGKIIFRQVQYEAGQAYLTALNPHFSPVFEPFEIVGRVVGRSEVL